MKYCWNCGNQIADDDVFCQKCGKKQTTDTKQEQDTKHKFSKTGSTETKLGIVINYDYKGNKGEYLSDVIKRKSLNRLKLGVVLVIIGLIFCLIELTYLQNVFSGPRDINGTDLENELTTGQLTDLNIALNLTKDNTFDSGYYHYTQETNTTTNTKGPEVVTKKYYVTLINKHLLILEMEPNSSPTGRFEGALKPIDTDLRSKIVTDLEEAVPEFKGNGNNIVLSYIATDSGIYSLDNLWVVIIGIILLGWGWFRIIKWIMDPSDDKHYIKGFLNGLGYKNLSELSTDYINSYTSGIINIGNYEMSNKFLSREGTFKFEIHPLSQLYWIYKKVTSHSINFIPTGKSYGVVLHFKPNTVLNIGSGDQTSIEYLTAIYTICPWIQVGYPMGAVSSVDDAPKQSDHLPKCPKCGREYATSRTKCNYCGVDLV